MPIRSQQVRNVTPNLANLRDVVEGATAKALVRSAVKVQNQARRNAPVDTGLLRQSITYTITGVGETAEARVGSNLDYALGVETGTGIYGPKGRPITPVRAKALRFPKKGGGIVFAASVRGRPGTPYLKPALRALAEE